MKSLFWKLQYTLILNRRADLPLAHAWQVANSAWEDCKIFPCTPYDAVSEELACWSE